MPKTKTHSEKTASDNKSIGFDYQYYFFLYTLLRLRTGESVGLEVSDDVHTKLANDVQILYQLKHTVQTNATGAPINLTTYDSDFWKTLSNWSKVVSDKEDGRASKPHQLAFLRKTEFVLVSNKSKSKDTTLIDFVAAPRRARAAIKSLRGKTKDETIQTYMDDILSLEVDVLKLFIAKISFELEVDLIIEKCKTALRELHMPPHRIEQLFRDLDSQIRQDNFIAVKAGEPLETTFEEFDFKYRRFFDLARSTELTILKEYDPLPERLEAQTFMRQLLEIGDLVVGDVEGMTEFTTEKKIVEKNLLRWHLEGELTEIEMREFDEESKARWQNVFRQKHRDKTAPNSNALNVIDAVRTENLNIGGQQMGTKFSNGQYYKLADIPVIGFLPDWEKYLEEDEC